MIEVDEKLDLIVIKRNGKKVDFDGSKIALAIKKGFDSVNEQDEETGKYKYDTKDITKIYNDVIKSIEKNYKEKIKIEEIQDLIEVSLEKKAIKKFMIHFLIIEKDVLIQEKCLWMIKGCISF